MRRSTVLLPVFVVIPMVVSMGARKATLPVLIPGSADVTTTHIRNASANYRYLMRPVTGDTTERETGTGHVEESLTTYNGKPAVMLVSVFNRPGHTFADTALVMRAGLIPVWEMSHADARVTRFEYAGKQVHVTVTSPDSGTRKREHAYDVPVFHFNELDMLLRSLPLRDGYEAILPLYSEGSDELEMDSVRVESRGADGVWSVRFADPAIVAMYGIHGTTRAIVRHDVMYRPNGVHTRKVVVK